MVKSSYENLFRYGEKQVEQDCSYDYIGDVYNLQHKWGGCKILKGKHMTLSIDSFVSETVALLDSVHRIECDSFVINAFGPTSVKGVLVNWNI